MFKCNSCFEGVLGKGALQCSGGEDVKVFWEHYSVAFGVLRLFQLLQGRHNCSGGSSGIQALFSTTKW